jgi:catechol 2,3-dioxygenase-like lactoylglutathione lyase family enzyme
MATLQLLRSMLNVDSIAETIAFYEGKLGFRCIGTWGEDADKPTWCQMQRDDVRLMFTHSEPHTHDDGEVHVDEPALGGSLYINVDDTDALFEEFKPTIEGFEWEPQTFPHGMREFALRDCNGFLLVFGQEAPAEGEEDADGE